MHARPAAPPIRANSGPLGSHAAGSASAPFRPCITPWGICPLTPSPLLRRSLVRPCTACAAGRSLADSRSLAHAYAAVALRLAAAASLARAVVSCLQSASSTLAVAGSLLLVAAAVALRWRCGGATPRCCGLLACCFVLCLPLAGGAVAVTVCRRQIALSCVTLRLAAVASLVRAMVVCF